MVRRLGEVLLTAGLCWGWVQLFVLPYCGLLFRCGCTWPWAGGVAHCNIYDAGAPDCPWCMAPGWAAWIPFQGIIGVMTIASVAAGWRWRGWWARPVAGVVAFVVFGLLSGVAFKVAMGYPYFLWHGPS